MPNYPPWKSGESVNETASSSAQPQAATAAATDQSAVWSAHNALTLHLREKVGSQGEVASFAVEDMLGTGNLVGVGVGVSMPRSTEWVAEPGIPCLRVYLREPMHDTDLRRMLVEVGAPDTDSVEMPVEPVVTGEIRAFPHTFRDRPAPGGISVGHVNITAGTLGCLARGLSGDRSARTLILSNNHVLADTNAGSFGDVIIQPGRTDGGSPPADQIAALERFVPISFTAPNTVDCATAWADPDRVRRELVFLDRGGPRYFRITSTPRRARLGDSVGKSGRTTQLTAGRIANVAATVTVRYGGRTALFQDQIEIVAQNPSSGPFSRGGDSGSVIWTQDEERQPVGLLFAGGGGSTFANHMDVVLTALDIELVT